MFSASNVDDSPETATLLQNEKCDRGTGKIGRSHLVYTVIDDLCIEVHFGVVHNLVVDVLFGTSFINLYIRSIFLAEYELVPRHSQHVAISHRPRHRGNSVSAVGEPADKSAANYGEHSVTWAAKKTVV